MKVIAMYLPQFHRVKENDEWWGEGFTEWTAVKKADQLYSGHYQPRIPYNHNYYDLLEKDTMLWQATLMKKYGIDGMCMYHYWFKDGRQILEKPAENLLKWEDINMPFCFCWANETWARTWSNLRGVNIWSDTFETKEKDSQSNGILLEQKYGGQQQWEKHFEYLLPFFKDKRYIKIEGKPLFLIYKSLDIPCLVEMVECWRKLALENGFKGIYIIGSGDETTRESCMDATIYYQPVRSRNITKQSDVFKEIKENVWEYDEIWQSILEENPTKKCFFEGIVGYDDTPRRGKKSSIIEHASPEKFSYYFTQLLAKSAAAGKDMVFLNAWNEWGEGMYLEPDERYQEQYLEAVKYAKENYMAQIKKYEMENGKVEKEIDFSQKHLHYMNILDYWMLLLERGVSITDWFRNAKYRHIAIYGYGILGRHLFEQLKNSDVTVEYIIDQQKEKIVYDEFAVYNPQEALPPVDVVVVSAVYDYMSIYQMLKVKGIETIISLETVLKEMEIK